MNPFTPGSAPGGKHAIWQLGQMQLYDSGLDGDPMTPGDNTLFLTQGIFIP